MLIYLTEICNGSLDHYLSGKKLFETMQVNRYMTCMTYTYLYIQQIYIIYLRFMYNQSTNI